jgi:folate-binding protein YgfZ
MSGIFHQTLRFRFMPAKLNSPLINVCELKSYSILRISGKDRNQFLQGQFTQDLDVIDTRRSALTGWTTAKGRLLAIGQLMDWNESIYLPLPATIAESVARRLTMFVLRADVEIDFPDLQSFGLVGESTDALDIDGLELPPEPGACRASDNLCVARVAGDPVRAWAIGNLQTIGTATSGADRITETEWLLQNIRAGIPAVGLETTETFIPQMLNLDLLDGISFTKGCYVGQEIVARTQNLGRIKRRMYRFRTESNPSCQPGQLLFGPDDATGRIVSCARDKGAIEMLAVIPISASDGPWHIDEDRTIILQRKPLPYPVNH